MATSSVARPDHDGEIGEVERAAAAAVDEVGHVAEPEPIDEIAETAPEHETESDCRHHPRRFAPQDVDREPGQRNGGQQGDGERASLEMPAEDAAVADVVNRERADGVDRLSERERRANDGLRHLVGGQGRRGRNAEGDPWQAAR